MRPQDNAAQPSVQILISEMCKNTSTEVAITNDNIKFSVAQHGRLLWNNKSEALKWNADTTMHLCRFILSKFSNSQSLEIKTIHNHT